MWTLETKSLLPSLYKREGFPSLVSFSCLRTGKEGLGEISSKTCLLNYGLMSKLNLSNSRKMVLGSLKNRAWDFGL